MVRGGVAGQNGPMDDARAGSDFGDLRLGERLRQGPLGPIYAARSSDGEEVSVELVPSELTGDPDSAGRLESSAEAAAGVDHPALVRVRGICAGRSGELGVVRDLAAGATLARLLADGGPLEAGRGVGVLADVLAALEAAHEAGVLHGDIRPECVVVGSGGRARLDGLGLAAALEDAAEVLGGSGAAGVRYAAPERSSGTGDADARADLYSVGAVAFELLTGSPPFSARNALELVRLHRQEPPPALASVRPELPGCLEGVVRRALAKEPGARFPSARAFREALEALPVRRSPSSQETVDIAVDTGAGDDARRPTRAAGGGGLFDDLVGTVLDGQYRILEKLGEGGMGAVFRARSELLGNEVAVKVIRGDLAGESVKRERFLREARAALEFAHPNAVATRSCRETPDGLLYMTLDLSPGQDLRTLLEEQGRLEPARALGLTRQALMALAEAHAKGIVHRDLKPENMLVETDEAGRELLRVCDFGIAKLLGPDDRPRGKALTASYVIGTPAYMAPEQASGGKVDRRTDLYAMGCVLFELLSGELPFDGEPQEVLLAQISSEPPSPQQFVPTLPDPLADLVLRALSKRAADRFPSAEAFMAAIDGLDLALPERSYGRRATPTESQGAEEPSASSGSARTLAVALAVLVGLGAAIVALVLVGP